MGSGPLTYVRSLSPLPYFSHLLYRYTMRFMLTLHLEVGTSKLSIACPTTRPTSQSWEGSCPTWLMGGRERRNALGSIQAGPVRDGSSLPREIHKNNIMAIPSSIGVKLFVIPFSHFIGWRLRGVLGGKCVRPDLSSERLHRAYPSKVPNRFCLIFMFFFACLLGLVFVFWVLFLSFFVFFDFGGGGVASMVHIPVIQCVML